MHYYRSRRGNSFQERDSDGRFRNNRSSDDFNTYSNRGGNDYRRVNDDRYDYHENDRRSYNDQYNNDYNRNHDGYRDYDDYNRRDYNDYNMNERRRYDHDHNDGGYYYNGGQQRDWGGSGNRDVDRGSYNWDQRNGGFQYGRQSYQRGGRVSARRRSRHSR